MNYAIKADLNRENQIRDMIVQQLKKAKAILKEHKVVLYGSRAYGNARPLSDFDIGILGKEPMSFKSFYQLEDMMEDLPTLYKIDLVDLNRTSDKFRQHALKHTITLYE